MNATIEKTVGHPLATKAILAAKVSSDNPFEAMCERDENRNPVKCILTDRLRTFVMEFDMVQEDQWQSFSFLHLGKAYRADCQVTSEPDEMVTCWIYRLYMKHGYEETDMRGDGFPVKWIEYDDPNKWPANNYRLKTVVDYDEPAEEVEPSSGIDWLIHQLQKIRTEHGNIAYDIGHNGYVDTLSSVGVHPVDTGEGLIFESDADVPEGMQTEKVCILKRGGD